MPNHVTTTTEQAACQPENPITGLDNGRPLQWLGPLPGLELGKGR